MPSSDGGRQLVNPRVLKLRIWNPHKPSARITTDERLEPLIRGGYNAGLLPCKEEEDEVKVSLDKKIQAVNLTDGVFG